MNCRDCKCVSVSLVSFSNDDYQVNVEPVEMWSCKLMFSGANRVHPGNECHFEDWGRWFEVKRKEFKSLEKTRDKCNSGKMDLDKVKGGYSKKHVGWV